MTPEILVTIRGIAAGGDGVASLPDGRTVFVPRSAVGDTIALRDVRLHARFARAEIGQVVTPGADRVDPPCPHFVVDRCGGCQLMHLTADAQRAAKSRIAGDALRRVGKIDLPDPPMTAAPDSLGYRSKITLTLANGRLGYHVLHDAGRVFDLQRCLIAEAGVQRLHAAVRGGKEFLPRVESRVVLRRDIDGGFHVVVETPRGDAWTGATRLHTVLLKAGIEAVIWWHPEGGQIRAMAGAADPWQAVSFAQVYPAMGATVRQAAIDALGDLAGRRAWDLYAGVGETTALLVGRGASVESIESDRRAVARATAAGPDGPRRLVGLVEEMLADLAPTDVVVTNPPRGGMNPRAVDILAASGATRIAYISCDPATLARDLARLGERYRIRAVTTFDQFPQTAHLESLALLELA